MAKTFGVRPSNFLYPAGVEANFAFALDSYIFDIGFKRELEEANQLEQAKVNFYTEVAKRGFRSA